MTVLQLYKLFVDKCNLSMLFMMYVALERFYLSISYANTFYYKIVDQIQHTPIFVYFFIVT